MNEDFELISKSTTWLFHIFAGLLATFLFILAGNRQRQGDTFGAVFSIIGAIVVCLAPSLAKTFIIGD